MQQGETPISLGEAEFSNLCSHYKDTFDIHLACTKQRDTLFYALLVILALFSLQVTSADLINTTLSTYANKELDIAIDKNSNLFGTLLWLLLFGLSTKYYQAVIQIERQYDYLHHLEEILSSRYPGTRAFTREGKSYISEYPLFSQWMSFLYTITFPLIILVCIGLRMRSELNSHETLGLSLLPCFISYLLVGTSTILYIGKLHAAFFRKLLTFTLNAFRMVLGKRKTKTDNDFTGGSVDSIPNSSGIQES